MAVINYKAVRRSLKSLRSQVGSAMVGFIQSGAGAVVRAVQAKLRDRVDIRDFGAVCDGATDDAAAITAALATFTDYRGGVLYIPANTAIGSTITIANKKGLMIHGENGQGFGYVGASFIPSLKWIGASGGTMIRLENTLNFSMRYLAISGEDTADYGLAFYGLQSGWGVSNYEHLNIYGCNKNAVYKTEDPSATLNDYGRNHWKRCTFRKTAVASGTAMDDAIYVYNLDSGVQDVFDHCEWIYKDADGNNVASTYCIWFEAGTPRVTFRDCYTTGTNGIFSKTGGSATPKVLLADHYSEDVNFVSHANVNTRQVLRNCVHALGGGVSVAWGGASGGGAPLVIDGGSFAGTLSLTNENAPVVFANAPQFAGGWPTVSEPKHLIIIGRSQGSGVAATEAHGAINAAAFVPIIYQNVLTTNIFPDLAKGTVLTHTMTQNTTVNAPTTIDASGRDVGREIELQITGHASNVYTVTFNAVFKLAGAAYTHSGATKTDILRFRWNGTSWLEISRSMNLG